MVGKQIWPPVVDPATLTRQVWNVETARTIPGVGRALQLYGGLISQCPLDLYRGDQKQTPRPFALQLPDVSLRARSTYVRMHVEDYLVHGNAVHMITSRYADGTMQGTKWFPAHMWFVADPRSTDDGGIDYYLNGRQVPRDNVVHVQRGAAEEAPWRGVGVVEQHLKTLNRVGLEEAAESKNLTGGGVPSVAVIAPNPRIGEDEAKEAKKDWVEKFQGPAREPGIFPAGTKIEPLSWKPMESEMVEARKLSLVDVANAFNLDPYWLGAQSSSHTYKSPAPTFLEMMRTSIEPVMIDHELVWSLLWLPPLGRAVRFDRLQLQRDDFASEINAGVTAVNNGLMTVEEWRIRQGLPIEPEFGELKAAAATPQLPPGSAPLQLVPGGADTPGDDEPDDEDEEGTGS